MKWSLFSSFLNAYALYVNIDKDKLEGEGGGGGEAVKLVFSKVTF